MGFDTMRNTPQSKDSGLGDAMLRAMSVRDDLSVPARDRLVLRMRAAGFRQLEAAIEAENEQFGFRTLAPLPERAQVAIDSAVVSIGRQRLQFIEELRREGLVYNLPNAMSIPFLENNYAGADVQAPQRVMNPEARGEDQLPSITAGRLPIYITKDQFSLGIRELGMSRRIGMPLDTTLIGMKTRGLNEAIEDAGVNGATTLDGQALVVGGYAAPGLLTAPNANTKVLTASAWTGSTPVGATVMAEINAMFAQLYGDFKRGPFTLFVPSGVDFALNIDFKANGNDSIRTRLQQMTTGGRPLRIVTLDMLPSTKVVLAQMTSDVMDLVDGFGPTVVPYTSATGFTFHNIIMAIQVPRFRSDSAGNSGIVIGTLT